MIRRFITWIYPRLPSNKVLVRLTLFLITFCLIVTVVIKYSTQSSPESTEQLARSLDILAFKKSVSLQHRTVPKTRREDGLIPKIIHQTFKTPLVFAEYKPFIESCLKLNPDWQYYLWTDDEIVNFIEDKYPFFLPTYKIYKIHLQRADSIRYMILHHFGGIYIDMDVECVKPFYPSLSNMTAFVDQEAKEHAVLLHGENFTAMNSVMGSVPGHPFFLRLVFAMMEQAREDNYNVLGSTGPHLVTNTLEKWWVQKLAKAHTVTMLEPHVFSPIIDDKLHNFSSKCERILNPKATPDPRRTPHIHEVSKQLCKRFAERNWKSDLTGPETVGRHQFLHLGWRLEKRETRYFDVRSLVQNVIFYSRNSRRLSDPRSET